MEPTDKEIAAANERAARKRAMLPAVRAVRYDRATEKLIISLSTGADIALAPALIRGLERARGEDLAVSEISPSGFGIHFPRIDGDVYVPALLADFCGAPREVT